MAEFGLMHLPAKKAFVRTAGSNPAPAASYFIYKRRKKKMSNVRMKISPPWITYLNELEALFGHDSDINIDYDSHYREVKLFVEDSEKAAALDRILPNKKVFGNVTLYIIVIPANGYQDINDLSIDEVFNAAFKNNPVYAFSKAITGQWSFNCTYVVFKNRVVQFFNDNLRDIHGNISTLYQDIAEDVFAPLDGVAYCTDI